MAQPSPYNAALRTIGSRGALAADVRTKRDEGVASPGEMPANIVGDDGTEPTLPSQVEF